MDDTSLLIKQKMQELMQAKSPEQRLIMGCSMFNCSKQLVINAILRQTPNLTSFELRVELFLKFYGNDFDVEHREKIIRHFQNI
jgi:hypothetical protein